MTAQRPLRKTAALGATALALALPSWAQEGGLRYSLGISETLETVTNPGFETPAAPGTLSAKTALSLGFSSQTRTESLSFGLGTALTLSKDGAGIDLTAGQPHLDLAYSREAAGSALRIGFSYDDDRIETLRPITDFIGEDGQITLPENPEDLVGSGQRLAWGASAGLDLGQDGPLGLGLSADFEKINYVGATDPDMVDSTQTDLAARLRLDLTEVTSVSLGLSHGISDEAGTQTTARGLSLGLAQAVSPVLSLSGDLDYDLDDGSLSPRAGIDYALASGGLQLSLGANDLALAWQQELAAAAVSARVSHAGGGDGETVLALGYNQSLNAVSGLNLGISYTDERDAAANDVQRTELSASYTLAVGGDWALRTGLYTGLRAEETEGSSRSSAVFVTISRDFDILR